MHNKLSYIAFLALLISIFNSNILCAQTTVISSAPLIDNKHLKQEKPAEIILVEKVLGGHWTRAYRYYQYSNEYPQKGFAQYLDNRFDRKIKRMSLILGIVLPTVFGLTSFGITELVIKKRAWIAEHNGYIPCGSDPDSDGTEWCLFEPSDGKYDGDGYNVGIGLVAGISSLATAALLSVGIWSISKHSKKRKLLRPLLPQ